ncbi:hypothetical protein VOLCADRAFT_105081 [Volvox carteri f. nagariensis]|uniref:Topoisomerase 6 subunit A/Spo11 TOPRIM domain-containing protein n=1 Tax=Volvox carteri f. nagariensis TaxID=3068 RepID=D8TYB1_VOLCA|nr:uncharacterized protein VOLCADRAFT_105081 [Volvox carteri f. nagariensis]EFJ47521.1 hypothetical protein VOLCADRAFT_105081 [Volvox carteri f. nagariensis]|eukprot:XP_002951345.1 hypothetical protein VOLCADRAFT_105081 [Volvox carteri f. nagariensis]
MYACVCEGACVRLESVLAVLNAVHDLLRQGRQATQRDLYYTRPGGDVCGAWGGGGAAAAARRTRFTLGGLQYRRWEWVGPSGRALPGDMATIARFGLQLMSPAAAAAAAAGGSAAAAAAAGGSGGGSGGSCYLLVVEKDAVFQRLAEDRIWDHLPCVLLTARGMPDLATRAFAARLAASFPAPRLQPVGLVDYNPAGVVILATYKYGSDRLGPEGRAHLLPGLRWLGLRSRQLADVEHHHLQPLSERDRVMVRGLRERLGDMEPGWAGELDVMEASGYKGGGKRDAQAKIKHQHTHSAAPHRHRAPRRKGEQKMPWNVQSPDEPKAQRRHRGGVPGGCRNLGKIRTLVKSGLDPNGLVSNTSCFDNTTWVLKDRKPLVPLLVFSCFNGVPAAVLDLLIRLGALPNAVTDCGLPAPLAVLCAKITAEEHRALFQVLRQHRCSTFNSSVCSARNDHPIHITCKVLDLSDWTSPRKVEGIELLIKFGTFQLSDGGLDERAMYDFVATAVRHSCGHKLLDCLWRHFPQQLLPSLPASDCLLLRALADSWLEPFWRRSAERQHTVSMGLVLRALLEHPAMQPPQREAVAYWLRTNMAVLLYRPELVALLLDRCRVCPAQSTSSRAASGPGSPVSPRSAAATAAAVPLHFHPDDRDLVLPVGLLSGPEAAQGDVPLAPGMSLMLAYVVDPDEQLARQGGIHAVPPQPCPRERLLDLLDSNVLDYVDNRNLDLVEVTLAELLPQLASLSPSAAAAADLDDDQGAAGGSGVTLSDGGIGDRGGGDGSRSAACGGGRSDGKGAAANLAAQLSVVSERLERAHACLDELYDSERSDAELANDPEVWRAEAAVEALAAVQRCLQRAATAAAGGDGDASARFRCELSTGVAFVDVVAARIVGQPEWGFSRGLLLQLGLCQMRRALRSLQAAAGSGGAADRGADGGVQGVEAQMEVLRLYFEELLADTSVSERRLLEDLVSALEAAERERDLEEAQVAEEVAAAAAAAAAAAVTTAAMETNTEASHALQPPRATEYGSMAEIPYDANPSEALLRGMTKPLSPPPPQRQQQMHEVVGRCEQEEAQQETEGQNIDVALVPRAGVEGGDGGSDGCGGSAGQQLSACSSRHPSSSSCRCDSSSSSGVSGSVGNIGGPEAAAAATTLPVVADSTAATAAAMAAMRQAFLTPQARAAMHRAMLPGESMGEWTSDDEDGSDGGDDDDDDDDIGVGGGRGGSSSSAESWRRQAKDVAVSARGVGDAVADSGASQGSNAGCSRSIFAGRGGSGVKGKGSCSTRRCALENGSDTLGAGPGRQCSQLSPNLAKPPPPPPQQQQQAQQMRQVQQRRRRLKLVGVVDGGAATGRRRRGRRLYGSESGAERPEGFSTPTVDGWRDPDLLLGGLNVMSLPPNIRHGSGGCGGSGSSSDSSGRELAPYEYLGAAVMFQDYEDSGSGGSSDANAGFGVGVGVRCNGSAASSAYDTPSEGSGGDAASLLEAQARGWSGGGAADAVVAAAAAPRRLSHSSDQSSELSYGSAQGGYGSVHGYGPEYGLESVGGDMGALDSGVANRPTCGGSSNSGGGGGGASRRDMHTIAAAAALAMASATGGSGPAPLPAPQGGGNITQQRRHRNGSGQQSKHAAMRSLSCRAAYAAGPTVAVSYYERANGCDSVTSMEQSGDLRGLRTSVPDGSGTPSTAGVNAMVLMAERPLACHVSSSTSCPSASAASSSSPSGASCCSSLDSTRACIVHKPFVATAGATEARRWSRVPTKPHVQIRALEPPAAVAAAAAAAAAVLQPPSERHTASIHTYSRPPEGGGGGDSSGDEYVHTYDASNEYAAEGVCIMKPTGSSAAAKEDSAVNGRQRYDANAPAYGDLDDSGVGLGRRGDVRSGGGGAAAAAIGATARAETAGGRRRAVVRRTRAKQTPLVVAEAASPLRQQAASSPPPLPALLLPQSFGLRSCSDASAGNETESSDSGGRRRRSTSKVSYGSDGSVVATVAPRRPAASSSGGGGAGEDVDASDDASSTSTQEWPPRRPPAIAKSITLAAGSFPDVSTATAVAPIATAVAPIATDASSENDSDAPGSVGFSGRRPEHGSSEDFGSGSGSETEPGGSTEGRRTTATRSSTVPQPAPPSLPLQSGSNSEFRGNDKCRCRSASATSSDSSVTSRPTPVGGNAVATRPESLVAAAGRRRCAAAADGAIDAVAASEEISISRLCLAAPFTAAAATAATATAAPAVAVLAEEKEDGSDGDSRGYGSVTEGVGADHNGVDGDDEDGSPDMSGRRQQQQHCPVASAQPPPEVAAPAPATGPVSLSAHTAAAAADKTLAALLSNLATSANVLPRPAGAIPNRGSDPIGAASGGGGVKRPRSGACTWFGDGTAAAATAAAAAGGSMPSSCCYVLRLSGGGGAAAGECAGVPPPDAVMRALSNGPCGPEALYSWAGELRTALVTSSGCVHQRLLVVADSTTRAPGPTWLTALRAAVAGAVLGPVLDGAGAGSGGGDARSGGGRRRDHPMGGGGRRRYCPDWLRQTVLLLPLSHLIVPYGGSYLYQAASRAYQGKTTFGRRFAHEM